MIAILEANIQKICTMRQALQSVNLERQMVYFETASFMLQWLDKNISDVRLISLGSNLGKAWHRDGELIQPGSGIDVVNGLREYQPNCSVVIHSNEKRNNAEMGVELACQGINSFVIHRKVKNWIEKEWLPKVISGLELTSQSQLLKTVH